MILYFNTKVNFIFPLYLINNICFSFKIKCFILKYVFVKFPVISFVNSVKFIFNNYCTELKIFKHIKKNSVKSRNTLCRSTKKPWAQKGLGKSRSGSFKSPLWKGGSILFGPVNRIININLQKRIRKITFLYLLINKRTFISFIYLTPLIHTFTDILTHLNQQNRIKGIFSKKIIYVVLHDIKRISISKPVIISITSLNIKVFLKFDYIVFLV